jgi:hypothetical protein
MSQSRQSMGSEIYTTMMKLVSWGFKHPHTLSVMYLGLVATLLPSPANSQAVVFEAVLPSFTNVSASKQNFTDMHQSLRDCVNEAFAIERQLATTKLTMAYNTIMHHNLQCEAATEKLRAEKELLSNNDDHELAAAEHEANVARNQASLMTHSLLYRLAPGYTLGSHQSAVDDARFHVKSVQEKREANEKLMDEKFIKLGLSELCQKQTKRSTERIQAENTYRQSMRLFMNPATASPDVLDPIIDECKSQSLKL